VAVEVHHNETHEDPHVDQPAVGWALPVSDYAAGFCNKRRMFASFVFLWGIFIYLLLIPTCICRTEVEDLQQTYQTK